MKKFGWLIPLFLLASVSIALAGDLTFTEGNNFTEKGSFMVMGFVKNTSNYTMKDVTVTVKYYDKQGAFLRFASARTNPSMLGPGEEASYEVAIPQDERIASIKKTARWAVKEEI